MQWRQRMRQRKQKYLEIEDKVMKEETDKVTDSKYKEEQMRRNRWKGGKEKQIKRR